MKEVMPALARAGVLSNPGNAAMAPLLRAMHQRARAINVEFRSVDAPSVEKLDDALKLARAQVEALVVVEDGMFFANARRIAELATAHRLPSIGFREYCEGGGMVAYGVDFPYIWRQSGSLVDKILKGANPADLPIQQATRFEFIVNLRTAKLLGIEVPPTLSTRVDQVIR